MGRNSYSLGSTVIKGTPVKKPCSKDIKTRQKVKKEKKSQKKDG